MTGIDQTIGQTKVCPTCLIEKELTEYNRDQSRKDGLQFNCRECRNFDRRAKHAAHPEGKRLSDKLYRDNNKEKIAERDRRYRSENAKQISEWRRAYEADNKDEISARRKELRLMRTEEETANDVKRTRDWREKNPDRVKEVVSTYHSKHVVKIRAIKKKYKKKLLSTIKGRLEANISRGLRRGLAIGAKKERTTFSLLDFSLEELRSHLENQFQPGMTWDNYGEWHIDHIIPLSVHNYETPDDIDFKKAWALSNLQPLWAVDNMSKGAKLESGFQPSLAMALL